MNYTNFLRKMHHTNFLRKLNHTNFLRKLNHTNFLRKLNHTNFLRKLNHTNFLRKMYHTNFIFCVTNFLRYKFSAKKLSWRLDVTQFHVSLDLPSLLVVFQRNNSTALRAEFQQNLRLHLIDDDVVDYVLHCLQQVASRL